MRQSRSSARSKPLRDIEEFQRLLADRELGSHSYALLLGIRAPEWPKLLRNVERGFQFSALEHFLRNASLSSEQTLEWLQIAPRTLTRRKEQGYLLPDESDRLLRAARVLGRAIELFEGDRDSAVEWLLSSQPALGGAPPIELAKTEFGTREVEDLIGRLDHGVYS
jgi:putative toxin-antitoxin system antitoxin component (TIGR02293 family)